MNHRLSGVACIARARPRASVLARIAAPVLAFALSTTHAHDGELDRTFGRASHTPGTVVLDAMRYDQDTAAAVAIQRDGRILVAGNSETNDGSQSTLALVRLHPDGTQDMSFAASSPTPGAFIYPYGPQGSRVDAIAIDSSGRIVVGGTMATAQGGIDAVVWRVNGDGTLDPTFGSGGVTTFAIAGDHAHATVLYDLKLNPFDAIYVTGTYNGNGHSQYMLGLLGPDGSFIKAEASDFGPITPGDVVPVHLLVQADGKLVVAGYWKSQNQWLCMDARFSVTLDGSGFHFPLDTTYASGFGRNGLAYGFAGPAGEHFTDCFNDAILQRADGSYIAAGRNAYDNLGGGWIAQFYDLDATGDIGGGHIFRFSPFGDNSPRALLEQHDRKVVMAGFTGYDDGQGDTGSGFASARFTPDLSAFDPGWGNNGISFTKFDAINSSNDQSFAAAFDAYERTVMVGSSIGGIQSPSNKRFAIARLQSYLIFRNGYESHE